MIRIVKNELAKIAGSRKLLLLLVLLLAVNALLFYRESSGEKAYDAYSASSYKKIWADLEILESGKGEYLAAQMQRLSEYKNVLFGTAERSAEYALRYTDSIWKEEALYKEVLQEYNSAVLYGQYKEGLKEAADRIMALSIFSDKTSFSYRNAARLKEALETLSVKETKPVPSKGIRLATGNSFTDICVLAALFGCVLLLLTREKEEEVVDFMRTTCHGRSMWIAAKLAALFLAAPFLEILLYGSNLLLAGTIYGIYGWGEPVQSLYGFENCVLSLNLSEYLLLYFLLKLIAYWLAALLFVLPAVLFSRAGGVYACVIAAAGLFGVWYYGISDTSYASHLKYINPVAFLHTDFMLRVYKNLDFFSYPVRYLSLFLILAFFLLPALAAGNILLFANARLKVRDKGRIAALKKRIKFSSPFGRNVSVARQEAYKLFIGGKWLAVLGLYILFTVLTYAPQKRIFTNLDEYYYYLYITKLTGEQTPETKQYLLEEEAYLQALQEELWTAANVSALERINDELKRKEAFLQLAAHAEYLEKDGARWFFFDKGYRMLTGDRIAGKTDCLLALKALAVVILCASYAFSLEYQTGMATLLHTTCHGRGKTRKHKLFDTLFITTAVFAITYIPYYSSVLRAYGTAALAAPASSMEHLEALPAGISVGGFLAMLLFTRYLGLLLAASVLLAVSVRIKSYSITLLFGMGLFLAPLLLYFINLKWTKSLLFNPLFLGNYTFGAQ